MQPLALPPAQRAAPPARAALETYDAIQLFVERARSSLHTFRLTDQNAPAVARICQRLDGIPLGIELAAAWVNLLTPAQIASHLEQNFDLPMSHSRPVLLRHQTLRAAIEWSYNLLAPAERLLLPRLSVFVGGWNLAAAEAIVADEDGENAGLTRNLVLQLLEQLVNKSLVTVEHAPDAPLRFRLLEPLRDYLWEMLTATGELEALSCRHLAYFVALAERIDGEFQSYPQPASLACLEQEQENIRAALNWSLVHEATAAGLRLAGSMGRYWRHRGHYAEGRRWLLATLAQAPEPSQARAEALLWAGTLARLQGEMAAARPLCTESLTLFRTWGDPAGTALALENLGWTYADEERAEAIGCFQASLAIFRNVGYRRQSGRLLTTLAQMAREEADFATATHQLEDALVLLRAIDDPQGIAQTLNGLAELASLAGDYGEAEELLTESQRLLATAGSTQDRAWVHCGLTENCWHRGDYPAAIQHGEHSYQLFQELGSAIGMAIAVHHLSLAWFAMGQVEQAAHCLHSSLALCRAGQHEFMAARCLAGLGGVALRRDKPEHAVQLLATAAACFARHPHQLAPADEAFYAQLREACRAQLDEPEFSKAWAVGEALSVEECIEAALAQRRIYPAILAP